MAAPSAVTIDMIVEEGLRKAGYSSPSISQLTRAKGDSSYSGWMEEIKNDIWTLGKKLQSLQTAIALVTTQNQAKYPLPTDFSSDLTLVACHGDIRGTAQGGSANTITLASSETASGDQIEGNNIIIYSGTGYSAPPTVSSMARCKSYNSTTKVATMDENWSTAPNSTSKYMIIDTYYPLTQVPIWDIDAESYPDSRGQPSHYALLGDSDDGEFILYKIPYHNSDVPYGLILRYYADLMELDLSGILMSTLYKKWRNIFTQGIFVKTLETNDDVRANIETQKYNSLLKSLIIRETYGMDLSAMRIRVNS